MKLAVVGSREGINWELVFSKLDSLLARMTAAGKASELVIVSGGARGVDSYGEQWARSRGIPTEIYHPDWQTHGKSAGFLRNTLIMQASDSCVAFGETKGTADTVRKFRAAGKTVTVYTV